MSTKVDRLAYDSHAFYMCSQNIDSKGMREQRLDLQRRAAETSDDDLIPFGDRPTVSRFGAISRTSKAMYQNPGAMQAMTVQGTSAKAVNVSGTKLKPWESCFVLFFNNSYLGIQLKNPSTLMKDNYLKLSKEIKKDMVKWNCLQLQFYQGRVAAVKMMAYPKCFFNNSEPVL